MERIRGSSEFNAVNNFMPKTWIMVRRFFCFDLYTTGLLIGWLGLAESITSCIFAILTLENVDSMITPKEFPDVDDIVAFRQCKYYCFMNKIFFLLISFSWIFSENLLIFFWNIFLAFVTILGFYIAFNLIDLLASGLLIAGTVKVLH